MMRRLSSTAVAIALVAVAAGCSDTAGPSSETRAAAGIYVLQPSDQPYEPESGTMYLAPNGNVERHVSYHVEGQSAHEEVSRGTFHVEGSSVYFKLITVGTDFPYTWQPIATIDGRSLTISYPGPADGQITEVYRR